MKWLAALVLIAACDPTAPADMKDCAGDFRGVWTTDDGRRFDVIATDRGWEMYPMHDDRPAPASLPAGVVAAPGMIELPRAGTDPLPGTFTRRYENGAVMCNARTPVLLHDCHGDRAALDVRPPPPPADLALCVVPEGAPETWQLSRR
jgi:hypothetical protein